MSRASGGVSRRPVLGVLVTVARRPRSGSDQIEDYIRASLEGNILSNNGWLSVRGSVSDAEKGRRVGDVLGGQ